MKALIDKLPVGYVSMVTIRCLLDKAAAIRFSKVKQLSCTLDGKCRTRHFVKLLFLNLTLTKVSENRFCLVLAGQISYRTIYYLVELYIRPALYYYKGSFPWYYHIWEVMADRPHGNKSIWGIVSRIANVPFTPPASSPVSYTHTSERQLLKSWMPTYFSEMLDRLFQDT